MITKSSVEARGGSPRFDSGEAVHLSLLCRTRHSEARKSDPRFDQVWERASWLVCHSSPEPMNHDLSCSDPDSKRRLNACRDPVGTGTPSCVLRERRFGRPSKARSARRELRNVNRVFYQLRVSADLSWHRLHDLRHAFATFLLDQGEELCTFEVVRPLDDPAHS